ncbi:MAG: hypothetical protein LBG19_12665 [Prevotellaceae bacterium]|jgi:hypothetical protein|nr:hypothetical protein [Prevotellaceae bacterium]
MRTESLPILCTQRRGIIIPVLSLMVILTIYDYRAPERKIGVKIVVKGKIYDLRGKPETATRTLRVVNGYDNVSGIR